MPASAVRLGTRKQDKQHTDFFVRGIAARKN
jgi:hypothetical protein